MSSEYTGFFFKNYKIKQYCHFLVNKCKIFKILIETIFLRLFEPDQSEIKEIVQEIVNIQNGAIFKNGTRANVGFNAAGLGESWQNCQHLTNNANFLPMIYF